MMVPGCNALNMGLSYVQKQTVQYYQYDSRTENIVYQDVTTYAAPISIQGSLQPVTRTMKYQYGLNLQNDYYTFYAPKKILDVARDISGDQIVALGRRFQVESANDWYAIDGWVGVLLIDIGPSS